MKSDYNKWVKTKNINHDHIEWLLLSMNLMNTLDLKYYYLNLKWMIGLMKENEYQQIYAF